MRQKAVNAVDSRISPMKKKAARIRLVSPGLKVLPKKLPPLLSWSAKREVFDEKPMKREIFHEKHESEKSEMTFKEILTFGSGAVFCSRCIICSGCEFCWRSLPLCAGRGSIVKLKTLINSLFSSVKVVLVLFNYFCLGDLYRNRD